MTRKAASRQWTRTPTVAEFDQLFRQYGDHLTRERGLARQTVAGYQTVARQFLAHAASSTGLDLSGLEAAVVSQFVVPSRADALHRIDQAAGHGAAVTPSVPGPVRPCAGACRFSARGRGGLELGDFDWRRAG